MKIKRVLVIFLACITLSLSINIAYSSAVAVPFTWTVPEVVGTLLSWLGVRVKADNVQQFNDKMESVNSDIETYIDNRYINDANMASKVLSDFRNLIANSELTGKIENVSSDLFGTLKGFVSNLLYEKASINVNPTINVNRLGYYDLCNIVGLPYEQSDDTFYEDMIYGRPNVCVAYKSNYNDGYTTYEKIVYISNLSGYYVKNGNTLDCYIRSNGEFVPYLYLNVYKMQLLGNSIIKYIQNGNVVGTRHVTAGTEGINNYINISNVTSVYNTYDDMINDNIYTEPISVESDYVFIPGVEKVWDKYGNLDNLGVGTATGVISGDVVGTDTWERVIGGSIALEDIIPFPLVDTKENVLIDDAYVDDNVDDTPYENVDYGDIGDYTMGGIVTSVFPFCIPFDLIRLFRVLSSSAEAPRWELPLNVPMLNFSYTFVIDLAPFEQLASIFRIMETIMFIIGLILVTRKLIGD